jgi:hypothetical protein
MSEESSSQAPRRPLIGPRAIAETVARLTRKPLGQRGFVESQLIAEWPAIVGSALGQASMPLKIVFPRGERAGGILHIRTASGGIAIELQHLQPLVLQRINGHFGYAAVVGLSLVQGPLPPRRRRKPPVEPLLPPAEEVRLAERLAIVEDPELRAVLARLGRRLAIGGEGR